jgi:hypothetical protein
MPHIRDLLERNAVSILSRLGANRHLDDDALLEIWAAATSTTDPHLTSCAHCRARFASIDTWLDDIGTDARAESEEAISPERLAAQQAQIFRRLEALERPARIITFPKFTRARGEQRRVVPRWVPTAAAAGLVIGLATGQLFNLTDMLNAPRPATNSGQVADNVPRPPGQPSSNPSVDEAIFYGDADLTARSAQFLSTLDELTPRARDDDRPR